MIEVNAHSLFSKYFSESGKLVSQLFSKIMEYVEEPEEVVFVLIDEVESLAAARKAAVAGNEPADAIRAVNALLTHLDSLRHHQNAMILCTSNLPEAVDAAFVDRADIKVCIASRASSCVIECNMTCFVPLLWSFLAVENVCWYGGP
jgi:pachytene checkpoint protein 2